MKILPNEAKLFALALCGITSTASCGDILHPKINVMKSVATDLDISAFNLEFETIPHDVMTNTLVTMERIVTARCISVMEIWRSTSLVNASDLSWCVEPRLGQKTLRQEIDSVIRCRDEDRNIRVEMLHDVMFLSEREAQSLMYDSSSMPPIGTSKNLGGREPTLGTSTTNDTVSFEFEPWNGLGSTSGPQPISEQASKEAQTPASTNCESVALSDTTLKMGASDHVCQHFVLPRYSKRNAEFVEPLLKAHFMALMYKEYRNSLLEAIQKPHGSDIGFGEN